jgi:hypothetical protein
MKKIENVVLLCREGIKMPYITENDREDIDLTLFYLMGDVGEVEEANVTLKGLFKNLFIGNAPPKPGELNYIITTLVHSYIERKGLCYTTLNEAIGVLECAKLELYRMVVAPYENGKQSENGPISELDGDS